MSSIEKLEFTSFKHLLTLTILLQTEPFTFKPPMPVAIQSQLYTRGLQLHYILKIILTKFV